MSASLSLAGRRAAPNGCSAFRSVPTGWPAHRCWVENLARILRDAKTAVGPQARTGQGLSRGVTWPSQRPYERTLVFRNWIAWRLARIGRRNWMTIWLWGRRPRAVTPRKVVGARLFDAVPYSGRKRRQEHRPRWGDQVTPVPIERRRRHSNAALHSRGTGRLPCGRADSRCRVWLFFELPGGIGRWVSGGLCGR